MRGGRRRFERSAAAKTERISVAPLSPAGILHGFRPVRMVMSRCLAKSFCRDTNPVLKKRTRDLAKKKKVVRRAWTSSEVRDLKSLAKKKVGVAKIAKAIKRTIGATAAKAHQLGVSLDTRGLETK